MTQHRANPLKVGNSTVLIHAHRGDQTHFPENTLEAYESALAGGVSGIEVDVGLTSDHVLVLHHDRSIGGNFIKDISYEELSCYQIGAADTKNFPLQTTLPEARVPTLDEVIQLLKKYPNAQLNLDVKTSAFHSNETHDPEDFVQGFLKAFKDHGLEQERIFFQSFDPRFLMALRDAGSMHTISYLMESWSDDLEELAEGLKLDCFSPRIDLLNKQRCAQIKMLGTGLFAWTANKAENWSSLLSWGVDGIITDDPLGALQWRSSRPRGRHITKIA